MSTTTKREPPSRAGGSVDQRLARLMDTPFFARVVPHLAPETLHQLIQYRGLDACGELVTSATPAQLTSLLDLDLWRHAQPGRDEQFDVDRFGEWLEVLVDTGDSVAARTVAALDKDLLNVSRVLSLSPLDHVRRIVLPAAIPMIFTGLRLSLATGWMVLIAAEMLAQNPGLGKFIWDEFQNGSSSSLARIMVAVLTIGIIGFMLDRVMYALQSAFTFQSNR